MLEKNNSIIIIHDLYNLWLDLWIIIINMSIIIIITSQTPYITQYIYYCVSGYFRWLELFNLLWNDSTDCNLFNYEINLPSLSFKHWAVNTLDLVIEGYCFSILINQSDCSVGTWPLKRMLSCLNCIVRSL